MPESNETTTTYLQAVTDLKFETWKLYDKASPLRDTASGNEKDAFNQYRGLLYDAALKMAQLQDLLAVSPRGQMKY